MNAFRKQIIAFTGNLDGEKYIYNGELTVDNIKVSVVINLH